MYQKRTIRKSPDSETRAMMRASNEIKIGLRRLKRTIETRQAVGKWLSQQREVRGELGELFPDEMKTSYR